eukprot:COSAG02_NODE_3129_length_7312_cov_338.294191_10_plen_53_part_00
MLVSRVTLGDHFAVQDHKEHKRMRRAPDRPGGGGLVYDSELHPAPASQLASC